MRALIFHGPGDLRLEDVPRPALVDDGDSVSVALLDTREAADAAMRSGVVRLMRIALKDHVARYEKGGAGFAQSALQLKTTIASSPPFR